MAEFIFNNGDFHELKIAPKHSQTGFFITAIVKADDDAVKIAGHSIANLDGDARILDVQFVDHKLGHPEDILEKKLVVIIDVSKFKVTKKNIREVKMETSCTLRVEAGDTIVEDLVLDDKANPEANSIFIYLVKFIKS